MSISSVPLVDTGRGVWILSRFQNEVPSRNLGAPMSKYTGMIVADAKFKPWTLFWNKAYS